MLVVVLYPGPGVARGQPRPGAAPLDLLARTLRTLVGQVGALLADLAGAAARVDAARVLRALARQVTRLRADEADGVGRAGRLGAAGVQPVLRGAALEADAGHAAAGGALRTVADKVARLSAAETDLRQKAQSVAESEADGTVSGRRHSHCQWKIYHCKTAEYVSGDQIVLRNETL